MLVALLPGRHPFSSRPRESWHPPGLFLSMLPLLLNLRKDGVGWRVRWGSRRPTPPAVSQADFCPKGRCNLILQSCLLQNPTLSIGPGEECLGPAFLVYPSRMCSDVQSPGQTESLPITRNSPFPTSAHVWHTAPHPHYSVPTQGPPPVCHILFPLNDSGTCH